MANNKSILINYGSEAITNDTSGFVPGKTATLYTSGHLLENDITVAFPSEYVIPEGEIEIKTNNTTVNVAGKATAKVQITIPEGPDVSGVDATAVDVLAGKWFYGKNGKQQGTLPNYYEGDFVSVLDANHTSIDLDGAYKGEVYIDVKNPATITANGTYKATSETVMTEVTIAVPSPKAWDPTAAGAIEIK